MDYSELRYIHPKVTAQEAADKALDILKGAEITDPGFLVYLLQNSNLLLLGGLRGVGPYNEFSPEMSAERLARLKQLLLKFDITLINEVSKYEPESSAVYSLINKSVFEKLPDLYTFLPKPSIIPREYTFSDLNEWNMVFHVQLVDMMKHNILPEEWLRDWWTPHNIRFGMLLGYPGPAISSNCWSEVLYLSQGKETPLDEYALKPESSYEAQVGFSIAPEARNQQEVVKLTKLWEDFLVIIRQRYDNEKLQTMPGFVREQKALEVFSNIDH